MVVPKLHCSLNIVVSKSLLVYTVKTLGLLQPLFLVVSVAPVHVLVTNIREMLPNRFC